MARVWDAMKKHEAEQAAQAKEAEAAARAKQGGRSPAGSTAPPEPPAPPRDADEAGGAKSSADGRYSELLVVHHDRGGTITEEYRSVRTSLLAQCGDGRFAYAVTSADAGEGKTVTCLNLGLAMAERVDRLTAVVDADMRKGRMADMLGGQGGPGMAELLRGSVALEDCLQPTAHPNLFFVPAGEASRTETGELIGRPELDEIVAELRRRYDYVIFDTPPINVISDAGILGRATGEALLVVRMNKTRREAVDKAVRLLHAANVKLSGVILTHRKYYIPRYIYRYS